MARLSITLDDQLVDEARSLAAISSKREVIEQALLEFVQRRRLAKAVALMGSELVDMEVDELIEWRAAGIRRTE